MFTIGEASPNYVFTDGSVVDYKFDVTNREATMYMSANSGVSADQFLFPAEWAN